MYVRSSLTFYILLTGKVLRPVHSELRVRDGTFRLDDSHPGLLCPDRHSRLVLYRRAGPGWAGEGTGFSLVPVVFVSIVLWTGCSAYHAKHADRKIMQLYILGLSAAAVAVASLLCPPLPLSPIFTFFIRGLRTSDVILMKQSHNHSVILLENLRRDSLRRNN